jgi:hypothetical protein
MTELDVCREWQVLAVRAGRVADSTGRYRCFGGILK